MIFKGIRVKNWQKLSNDMILLNPKQTMKNTLIIYSDSDDCQREIIRFLINYEFIRN